MDSGQLTVDSKEKWLEEILLEVRKPGRYLGNEWNVVKKPFAQQSVKFALCFPDLYELGMSNLGLRIIYGLLNSQEGISCERAFLPDTDMQALLRERKVPLFSLESKMPLSGFDFIGFSLSYELNYTNVLAVLDLAGIPWLAQDRDLSFPLVIAGGSCVSNPEPLADFIDLFLIGEAEDVILEVIDIYKKLRVANYELRVTKQELLKELAKLEGVYVPSFYEVEYNPDGALRKFLPKYPGIPAKIKKRLVKDLNQAYYPVNWIVPYIQIVHDRLAIELMRGCPHHCNFCQARNIYHSLRIRSPEKVLELARQALLSSGYEEISFLSLSTSEYPHLSQVVNSLSGELQGKVVSVSLPSLRPKSYLGTLAEYLAKVHKTTLTFAPEAGSQRLRQAINKNFSMDEFYAAVSSAYKSGWQAIKLYFMIGLPGEDFSDLDGILEIAGEVSSLRKNFSKYPGSVHLTVSFFVPKPHTAFELEAMDTPDSLKAKIAYLRDKAKRGSRQIRIDFHNLETSLIEAVFSRGDRSLSEVLIKAYQRGCVLDGWREHFKPEIWFETLRECHKDTNAYLKKRTSGGTLPWQHIVLD